MNFSEQSYAILAFLLLRRLRSESPNGDEVNIWEVTTGEEVTQFQGDTFGVTSLAWNPDGDRLAALGNRVVVWDVDTGQNLNILEFPNNEANSGNVDWNNDGRKLAFSRWNYDPQMTLPRFHGQ